MSTHGLYGYIKNQNYTAQFNRFDSHKGSLGVEFYKACKNDNFKKYIIQKENIEFIKESVFCEWAYFYDIENKIFEIWKGFQKNPDLDNPFGSDKSKSGYYPCKRILRCKIDDIPEYLFYMNDYDDEDKHTLDFTNLCISLSKKFHRGEKINTVIENDTNS